MGSTSFRVNSPTVVSETVDREVVMIHLDTGNYYSLRSTGALIWDALERGATVESITSALDATSHNGSDVGVVVGSFVDELMTEELIVPTDNPASSASATIEPSPDPFEPPVLEKYTDMQHLILLDPVHEVDEGEGWPRPRDDA
jgi:Coenzyme PQQ synthesis protein D (PqqD)